MNPEPLNEAQQAIMAKAIADMQSAQSRIMAQAKPVLRDPDAKPPPVKFSTYCKTRFPQASGIARRAARKAMKDNHRSARMDLARRKKNGE